LDQGFRPSPAGAAVAARGPGPFRAAGIDPWGRRRTATPEAGRQARGSGDAGFLVSWLIRLVVVLALVAVGLFELAAVLFAKVAASDTAVQAVEEAGFTYRNVRDLHRAEAAAVAKAAAGGAVFDGLTIDPQAQTATVTVHKQARTLVIGHLDAFEKITTARSTETVPLPR
jgi:hypothetical protein